MCLKKHNTKKLIEKKIEALFFTHFLFSTMNVHSQKPWGTKQVLTP